MQWVSLTPLDHLAKQITGDSWLELRVHLHGIGAEYPGGHLNRHYTSTPLVAVNTSYLKNDGRGLFAAKKLKVGTVFSLYCGRKISIKEAKESSSEYLLKVNKHVVLDPIFHPNSKYNNNPFLESQFINDKDL